MSVLPRFFLPAICVVLFSTTSVIAQTTTQQSAVTPPRVTHSETVSVTADVNDINLISPDPAEKVFVRENLLDANPGRPGAPISIPGYPTETASSGIKAHAQSIQEYLGKMQLAIRIITSRT